MRLEGERVYLRLLAAADTDHVVRWRSDPLVASQLFAERPPTRAEHEAWFARLAERRDRLEFVIMVREGDVPIGTVGLSRIDRASGEAEYGILIGEPAWRGKGAARECSELLLEYAFGGLGLREVKLNLFADNGSARGLYERLGFVETRAGTRSKRGVTRGTVEMRLSSERWEAWRRG